MATYEYCTVSEVQEELRATTAFSSSTNPSSTSVTRWIEQASDSINHLAGRVFGITKYDEYYDYEGEDVIELRHSPLTSVSSLTYATVDLGSDGRSSSWETQTEDTDFIIYKDRATVEPIFKNWSPQNGRKRIRAQYSAGYNIVPGRVQELCVKMVALRVLDTLAKTNVNDGNSGGSIAVGSISIVEPADFGLGSYQRLMNDIKMLKGEIVEGTGVYRY